MNWNAAIERNREALRRILAMLVAMADLPVLRACGDAAGGATLPRHLHRAILALLRPAEAAARRLVIVAARDLTVAPPPPRKVKPKAGSIFVRNGKGTGIVLPYGVRPGAILPGLAPPRSAPRLLALPLTDPLPLTRSRGRPATSGIPRISIPGLTQRFSVPRPPSPDDAIDATRLALRLQALGRVLDDLPREARRFARWRAGAAVAGAQNKNSVAAGAQNEQSRVAAGAQNKKTSAAGLLHRVWPLRPGRPPGGRRRRTHEVHEVLADLHSFAFWALEQFQQNRTAVLRPELRKDEETERPDTS
jgi:hypothetical protein